MIVESQKQKKTLNEEYQYILQRKKSKKFVGTDTAGFVARFWNHERIKQLWLPRTEEKVGSIATYDSNDK